VFEQEIFKTGFAVGGDDFFVFGHILQDCNMLGVGLAPFEDD
jgi:hypothetical protein